MAVEKELTRQDLEKFPKLAFMKEDPSLDPTKNQPLGQKNLELIKNIIDWYQHYDGKHWLNENGKPMKPEDLKTQNNLDYEPTLITANLTAWFIDKLAAFMFERPIGLACKAKQVDPPEEVVKPGYKPSEAQQKENAKAAAREQLLYKIFKQNLGHENLLKAAKDEKIGTAVCCKLHTDENLGMRMIWRPRLEFWPIYDEDDATRLVKIHFVAYIDDETIWKQTFELVDGVCYKSEATYNAADLTLKEDILQPTSLDIPFIPVEIFVNGGLTGETEGRSQVEVLMGLNDEVERKLSDNGDALRFGMFAIKAIINADLPTQEEIKKGEAQPLEVAPNALWALPSGDGENPADAKVLEHNFAYREALKDHLETVINLMHRLANVPNLIPEQIKGLGQLSGFAIRLMYGNIISATNQSMIVWKPRLERLFGKILYMLGKKNAAKWYDPALIRDAALGEIKPGDIDDLVEVKTQLPIPENEAELVDLLVKKITAKLESIKGAMDALGVENPEAKLAEILAETLSLREVYGDQDPPEDTRNRRGGNDPGQDGE